VAKLAGLPAPVLARANEVLGALEKADGRPKPSDLAEDLPLFRAAKGVTDAKADLRSPFEQAVADLAPDAMTPREALEALYRLKALLASEA
jgi:DNA mismatch repair protein MutS